MLAYYNLKIIYLFPWKQLFKDAASTQGVSKYLL